jgi:hypothetical protein
LNGHGGAHHCATNSPCAGNFGLGDNSTGLLSLFIA